MGERKCKRSDGGMPMLDVLSVLWVAVPIALLLRNYVRGKFEDKRKSNVEGPRAYPLIGCLFSMMKHQRNILEWFTHMLSQTPSQTIVVHRPGGLRVVVTANPTNVEHILKNRFENYPKGPRFTNILGDLLGNGIFNADGGSWIIQRKLASFQFSTRSLRSFIVEVVKDTAHQLIQVLDHNSNVDLQEVLQRFSFDSICKVSFGTDMNTCQPSLPFSAVSVAFDTATELSALRDATPIASLWKLKRILNIGSERRLREAIQTVHAFADDVMRQRTSEISGDSPHRQDLLSRFLESDRAINEQKRVFVRDMVVSFLLAGRDTTSSALTWFFWLISTRPNVEDAICAEIKRVAGDENELSYEDLQKMTYLHAALCEAMRLYPPVPVDSKHAVADDALPDGTMVWAGDRVTYHPYAMGRMSSIWGDDCLEYRPERWLTATEKSASPSSSSLLMGESPYRYPVFQAGMRVCLGKEMAFIQMKYVAASVLSRFRIRAAEASFRPRAVHCLTTRMHGGFPVVLSKR